MKKNIERGPGRPKYDPTIPNKRFTFEDFMLANGVNPKTGKGERCTKLTLTKFIDRDLWIRADARKGKKGKILRANPRSLLVRLADVFAEPNSKAGLGRKGFVYILRSKATGKAAKAPKAEKATRKARTPRTPRTADVSAQTKAYEEIKSILATPTPAPAATPAAVTVPAVTVTPTPAPAPVAPAPAPVPVAQESANAETATPVATPTPAETPAAS